MQKLLNTALDTAKEAGEFIRNERRNFDWSRVEQKQNFTDLVSYVDKEAERLIVERLRGAIEDAGFITEEGTGSGTGEVNWVIDPLDGTTNFLHNLPLYCTSIALVQGNKELLGVVYEINTDEAFYAAQGGGAFLNDSPIMVSKAKSLRESLIATGFPYVAFEKTPQYLEIFNHLMRNTHGLRRLGSAALDLAYVAAGRLEGFYEFALKPWDMAAGTLLVKEAGGRVTDFNGGDNYIFGDGMVSGCAIQQELLETVQRFWK